MTNETEELSKVGLREETVDINFTGKLVKHLSENEVICDTCGGLGLTITDNPFGIQGHKHSSRVMFPFKNQDLTFCPSCFNGVRKKCEFCGILLTRGSTQCKCEGSKDKEFERYRQKEQEAWDKAEKIPLKHALETYGMLYIKDYDEFVSTDSFYEWLETKLDDNEDFDKTTLKIYGTTEHSLSIDASSVIEDACEELHEDAMDDISKEKISELQNFINKWCVEVEKGTITYYADERKGVII